jgi:hypothetical protein
MSNEEKRILRTAIGTLADPRGNWAYGWRVLCEMANIPPPLVDWELRRPEGERKVEPERKGKKVA